MSTSTTDSKRKNTNFIIQQFNALAKANNRRVPHDILLERCLKLNIPKKHIADIMNHFLERGRANLETTPNGKIFYKLVNSQQATAMKGLDQQDRIVFQLVEQAGNKGIWSRTIREKSNLTTSKVVTKILSKLMKLKLIKNVSTIAVKNRKVYMLYELEPSREITGGAYYTGSDYNGVLIESVKQMCLSFIADKANPSLGEIVEFFDEKMKSPRLEDVDVKLMLDTLVLDSEVEPIPKAGGAPILQHSGPSSSASLPMDLDQRYRISKFRYHEDDPGANPVPCTSCPALSACAPGRPTNPETCPFMQKWLEY